MLSSQRHHQSRINNVSHRQGQQDLPSESHELVIAKAGQGPADPDVQEHKKENLKTEPEYRHHRLQNRRAKDGTMPSAEKQQSGHTGHGDHVGVFGHEKHGELHGAVLGVVSGHEFGFSFRQIKRGAVGFRVGGDQVDEKGQRLPVKNVPARNEMPEHAALRIHDLAQAEAAGHNQHAHQRESERHFVADHLSAGAQSTEQRIFVIRGPASQRDTIDTHRGNAEDYQQPDVQVGNLQISAPGSEVDPVAKGNHRYRGNRKDDRQDGRRNVERLVHMRLGQIFLENELDAVGQRLEQAKRSNPRGTPAVLDVRRHLTLQPDAIGHGGEQNANHGDRLDDRNDDDRRYAQSVRVVRAPSPASF